MNSRERLRTAFSHKTPDRPPTDYAAEPELEAVLLKHFDLPDQEALLKMLDIDIRHLDKVGTMVPKYIGPELAPEKDGIIEDMWGYKLKKIEYCPGCFYYEFIDPPLVDAVTVADIDAHRWPQPDWYDFSDVEDFCLKNREYALFAGLGSTLDSVSFFRGMEKSMLDLYDNSDIVEAIVKKQFEFKYEYNRQILEAAKGNIDVLLISEDMAGNSGLLVDRNTLKKYVYPLFKKFADLGHKHGAFVMLHSDGDIHQIIPDLIDLGIDVINPVQITLPGMDGKKIKKEHGDRICFHGLLDGQDLMPFSAPEKIKKEVRHIIDVMGENGGLAIAPSNNLQFDVPPENVFAAYQAVKGI
jgi:uroporphyrinogen decarboxylase